MSAGDTHGSLSESGYEKIPLLASANFRGDYHLTPVDVLRFVDTSSGTLPVLVPRDPVSGVPNSVGASVQPRGFGIVLPRGSQWGLTARYRF